MGNTTSYTPAMGAKITELVALGNNLQDIASELGISYCSIWRWGKKFPELGEAIKDAQELATKTVESSLYKRANGFWEGDKYYPPDPTSMIFYLKNKAPKEWRDNHDIELNGKFDWSAIHKDLAEYLKTDGQDKL